MKQSQRKSLSAIFKMCAVFFLFVPVFRLFQVVYRLLSQGTSAAVGEMARGTRGLSGNSAQWSGVVLEFGIVMSLYVAVGLAFLLVARWAASNGVERDIHDE